ncbi:MAG: hypothetical protein AAF928_00275 [Myxococcota bacterium]
MGTSPAGWAPPTATGAAPPPGGGGAPHPGSPPPGWGGAAPPGGAPPGGPPPGWGGGPVPGGGGFGYGGAPPPGAGYEFSPTENETIKKASLAGKVLAGAFALQALASLVGSNFLMVAIEAGLAAALFSSAKALDNVAESQGNDVMHLMEALRKTSTFFTIRIVLFCIALVLFLCAAGVAMSLAVAGSQSF